MLATLLATAAAATCHAGISHGLPAPDNSWACTPGAADRLTRQQACTPKDRPTLTASVRRDVLARYGVPGWTGKDGEIDHRQPLWLGGKTTRENLWPEPPPGIPNDKDKLENYIRRRVCLGNPYPMRLRTARRIFASDWRHAYTFYFLAGHAQ